MEEEKKSFNEDGSIQEHHEHESDEEGEAENYESEASTDSDGCEKCPICLLAYSNEIGRPKVCQHLFCFPCIDEWSKVMKTCPIDRREFTQIEVFDSLATDNLLRTVTVNENISIKEYTGDTDEQEFTPCEICRRIDREDVMLLCDGCDKGFHMDCLDPPILEIPLNNWYCSACENNVSDSSSEESEEVEEATDDIILREQPQIVRTRQSERVRNAILARRSLRGALHEIQRTSDPQPSTSRAIVTPPPVSMRNTRVAAPAKRTPIKRRKKRRRRARRVVEVVEYEIRDGQKFPTIKRTRKVAKRKKRKTKRAKKVKTRRSTGKNSSCGSTSIASSFKTSNSNVYDLQRGRQLAGLSNFNIFEPANLLDYVPDDEYAEEYANEQRAASTLTQSIINYTNPLRRQALINKRVLENYTSTSNSVNLLDSILNEQECFMKSGSKSNTKINSTTINSLTQRATDNDQQEQQNISQNNDNRRNENNENRLKEINLTTSSDTINFSNNNNNNNNDEQHIPSTSNNQFSHDTKVDDNKKKRKRTFDMFEDSPMNQEEEEEEQSEASNCPNFSIYDSVNRKTDENLTKKQEMMNEENVDLVQMSDDGEQNMSEEIEPAVVRNSQPASPDLENETNEQVNEEDRSYTPPIVVQKETKDDEKDDKSKKEREHKKHKRREIQRYNVRERFRSPERQRDRFGRNRTRTRSRSKSRSKRRVSKSRRSRSPSANRDKSRHRRSKSRNVEKRRKRSYSRSPSRKRDSSNERKHKKSKHKKSSYRRSKSISQSPRYHRDRSPRRRERSTSEKSKKKKHRNRSKEKSSTHTKEVFTSGQNILVSVNFNTQEEKRSRIERSKSEDKGNEPVVDITTKKKINVSSKPVVAIIDLARSPFRELTPEYKKESNVIELSDSEGEKQKPTPKSPDSTKLYDPFDIFNSPNENVSSSQNTLKTNARDVSSDFTNKLGPSIIKNLPLIANSEENLVSSSSSVNIFDKLFAQPTNNKIEVLQNEIIQNANNESNSNNMIESPYSPGNDDDYRDDEMPVDEQPVKNKTVEKESSGNILDELFGSSSPPASVDKNKSTGVKKSSSSNDPSKYLTKLKRQERVVEEVKLVIKPYYSKRMINKEQYKEIMRKAVPKICHNRTGEINPVKIKYLIDSYVKMYTHKKKRSNSGS